MDECESFSIACSKTTSYYIARGQTNSNKRQLDAYYGKLGEWAAFSLLCERFEKVSPPSHEIFTGRNKSHSADLIADNISFSVKTQTLESAKKYGISWLMEKNSIAKFKDQYFILCLVLAPNLILVQNIMSFEEMCNVQDIPKLAHLTSKAAFYYNDLLLNKIKELKNE